MNEVVEKKLRLLELSENYNVHKATDGEKEFYKVEDVNGDCYAKIFKDGKIEYWGCTEEYYDFEIDLDRLKQLVEFVEIISKE